MNILEMLNSHILKIYDKNDAEIKFTTKEIKYFKAKYSSAKLPSITLFLDGFPLTSIKKNKYKVLYKCKCGKENKIYLSKYLLKKEMVCINCRETEEKIEWHKLFFKMQKEGKTRGWKKRQKKDYIFDKETDEFKKVYFEKKLTSQEFDKAKKYIYSIDGIKVENKEYVFLPYDESYNGEKYTQRVIIDGIKHSLTNICLRCPLCGEIFHITRNLKERIKKHNFDCRKCYLNNKTFVVKQYDTHLTYQGKLELEFIERCKKNNILITNGDKLDYTFENKFHTYTIDFKLPNLKMLVEIKDNHIWHKKQIENGKWQCKEKIAKEYASQNGMTFCLLFPKDFNNFFKPYERDSQ